MAVILVTGATGFIGSHLTRRLLAEGHSVKCLVRATSQVQSLRSLDVELVAGNVCDLESVQRAVVGVDCVYHLAGLTSSLRRATLMQANGLGTWYVARACAQQTTPPVLIYVSSVAAAGPVERGVIRTEDDPPHPVSHYGHSKRAGEVAVEQVAERVPVTVVRPGIVFGEHGRETLPMFWSIEKLRVHAVAGYRSPPLSVIHVADLIELLICAAEQGQRLAARPSTGTGRPPLHSGQGYYFACRPEYPDCLQFGRLLQQALERDYVAYLLLPQPVPWIVGGIMELVAHVQRRSNSLNLDKIREATAHSWACSCHAAERDLRFLPQQPLLAQLKSTAQWYRQHGWL